MHLPTWVSTPNEIAYWFPYSNRTRWFFYHFEDNNRFHVTYIDLGGTIARKGNPSILRLYLW